VVVVAAGTGADSWVVSMAAVVVLAAGGVEVLLLGKALVVDACAGAVTRAGVVAVVEVLGGKDELVVWARGEVELITLVAV